MGVAALPIIAWAHNRWVTVLPARPPRRRAALVALVALVVAQRSNTTGRVWS